MQSKCDAQVKILTIKIGNLETAIQRKVCITKTKPQLMFVLDKYLNMYLRVFKLDN